jgi:hypothetical protein
MNNYARYDQNRDGTQVIWAEGGIKNGWQHFREWGGISLLGSRLENLHADDPNTLTFEGSDGFGAGPGVGDQGMDLVAWADERGAYLADLA